MQIPEIFASFQNLKVGVVGDVMLDTYMWGHVERISPEAPVPIVALDRKEYRVGGAGNVALNLRSLGARPSVISMTGGDGEGRHLADMFSAAQIDTKYILQGKDRITTNKMRIISRNQQMMRLDSEMAKDLTPIEEERLMDAAITYITREKPVVMIFEDYNKGVLTEKVIKTLITVCKENNVITSVDPKRKNFFCYEGVDIFKPNLKEAREALNIIEDSVSQDLLDRIHIELAAKLNHRISFITLSEKGAYYSDGTDSRIIPSHLRNIADVSGAGDTVIAVASLFYAVTRDIFLMAEAANIAGGLVCEDVGTVAIDRDRLQQECQSLTLIRE